MAENKQTTRLLLAEDDALLGDGLRAELRQLGFQVDWVRDGEAASCVPVITKRRRARAGIAGSALCIPGRVGSDSGKNSTCIKPC